ncbi:jerky protein homolog-like [Anthonomus grandis grandis]|uniref:jerky protein homolog-like n=1 Tax=Anthonomus grandis grandis TaxID=2921223 RepID=UPI0021659838|nr:jerky protein homolog-like [Anthonomus grandis grandis]
MLPDRTLAHIKEKSAPDRKMCKERITFLVCTNGDGSHKLNLLVIGKPKNPRSFENVQIPLEYKSTKNSWMTSALFKQWFHESFVKQVKTFLRSRNLEERALLIVDNAPSHATKEELVNEDGNIVTMFLPPNCTALIQPMDQNVIRLTKMHYRNSILATIISSDEQDITKRLKSVTLKDAMFILNDAWSKIPSKTIEKCWRNILSKTTQAVSSDTEYDSDDLMPLSVLKEKIGQQNLTDNIQDNISGRLNQLGGKETSFTHLDVNQ